MEEAGLNIENVYRDENHDRQIRVLDLIGNFSGALAYESVRDKGDII